MSYVSKHIAIDYAGKYIYWKIKDPAGNKIADQQENIAPEDSKEQFAELINNLTGIVNCSFSKITDKDLGAGGASGKTYTVKLNLSAPQSTNVSGTSNTSADLWEKILQEREKNFELKLKQEKSEKTTWQEKLVDKLIESDQIGSLVKVLTTIVAKVAAPQAPAPTATISRPPEYLHNTENLPIDIYLRLKQIDPGINNTLDKFATHLESNPGDLANIKAFLNI